MCKIRCDEVFNKVVLMENGLLVVIVLQFGVGVIKIMVIDVWQNNGRVRMEDEEVGKVRGFFVWLIICCVCYMFFELVVGFMV